MKTAVLTVLLSVAATAAASPADCPPDQNAALRYWMAFASMENPPADQGLAERLEAVSEGREPWDDALGGVVEGNRIAVETMHRGSRLPFCDWGLEAEMLADAPVAHVARGRALGRLNVLHGKRLFLHGQADEAVDAWLAGVRFSRHLTEGGPWLSALVASAGLEIHFRALAAAEGQGKLSAESRGDIERELEAMPVDGFDWSAAVHREATTLSGLASHIAAAEDPLAMLSDYFDSGHGPNSKERLADLLGLPVGKIDDPAAVRAALLRTRDAVDRLRPVAVAAFQEPYADSIEALREVDTRAAEDPTLDKVWPRAFRMNERRGRLVEARAELLQQLRDR